MDVQASNYVTLGLYCWGKGLKNPSYQKKHNWDAIAASEFQGCISSATQCVSGLWQCCMLSFSQNATVYFYMYFYFYNEKATFETALLSGPLESVSVSFLLSVTFSSINACSHFITATPVVENNVNSSRSFTLFSCCSDPFKYFHTNRCENLLENIHINHPVSLCIRKRVPPFFSSSPRSGGCIQKWPQFRALLWLELQQPSAWLELAN